MKATGIVRRIDDLGRVVIPKEIRKTLRIREGDSLEIYTENAGEIILKTGAQGVSTALCGIIVTYFRVRGCGSRPGLHRGHFTRWKKGL